MGKSEYEIKARQLLREQEDRKSEIVILRATLAEKEKECERLREALADIASGEMGINSSIRAAKQALEGKE